MATWSRSISWLTPSRPNRSTRQTAVKSILFAIHNAGIILGAPGQAIDASTRSQHHPRVLLIPSFFPRLAEVDAGKFEVLRRDPLVNSQHPPIPDVLQIGIAASLSDRECSADTIAFYHAHVRRRRVIIRIIRLRGHRAHVQTPAWANDIKQIVAITPKASNPTT
jgi:hypothetical protein